MRGKKEIEAITRIDEIEENEFANQKINNRYLLISQIGKGTFGLVYKAKDLVDSRLSRDEFVAIKIMVLPKTQSDKDKIVEAEVKDEIKKYATQIFNKRVVNIRDSFEWNKLLMIVMEYVDGKSLKEIVKERNHVLTIEEIIYYFAEISLAIQGMHDMKMIHRDLKPDNILLTANNKIKITDFGISHIKGFVNEGGNMQRTKKPRSPGTPRYTSPEQYLYTDHSDEDKLTYQADLYSLGVMMYESSTGSSIIKAYNPSLFVNDPKDANKLSKFYLDQTLIKEVIPPTSINPKIPVSLENIIMKCLEKNVADRYQTAQEVHDDLIRLENGEKIEKSWKNRYLKTDDNVVKYDENNKFKQFEKKFFNKKLIPAIGLILLILFLSIILVLVRI